MFNKWLRRWDATREKRKIEDYIIVIEDDSNTEGSTWLYKFGIQLFESDKLVLQSELSAHHIDFAQEVLKRQFPSICGLQCTLSLYSSHCSNYQLYRKSIFMQIVFLSSVNTRLPLQQQDWQLNLSPMLGFQTSLYI